MGHDYAQHQGHAARLAGLIERLGDEPERLLRDSGSVAHHALSLLVVLAPLLALAVVALMLIPVWRVSGRHRLARAGRWFELHLGERVERAGLEALMRTLAGGLPRSWLGATPWIALSVSAQEDRATCRLFVSGGVAVAQVRGAVEHALGGATVETRGGVTGEVSDGARLRVASLAPVGSRFLPLRTDHRVDPAGQVLAAMRAQAPDEGGVIQLVLQAPPRSAAGRARAQAAGLRGGQGLQPGIGLRLLGAFGSLLGGLIDFFMATGSSQPTSPRASERITDPYSLERAKAIDIKAGMPLLEATLRIGGWASSRRRAGGRLGGLLAAFAQFHDLGGLRRGSEPFCASRLLRCLPPIKPGLLLSSGEAAALIPVPQESALAPVAFSEAPSRRVAPVAQAPSRGLLLGRSDHSGFERELRVEPAALLQHAHVLGPTGRGKSTLLLNLAVEAIGAGTGGMVLDPTGELTGNILARVPKQRVADVELLDLGDTAYPPALNLLACSPADGDAQAQAICGIFARLFARFWGPRTEDILRSALTTLLCGRDPQGPTPTLADVLTLLSDPGERSRYRASDPVALDVFWRQWQTLSEPARVQALAPLSNKLRALLGNRSLRNMLCQPAAPDLTAMIREGRWLLVSLPQTLGEDAAHLVGSMLLHRAWQSVQRLGPLAHSDRPPFLCLVDECHRFCHLPQGMAATLAQARGYGLGLMLAHQHLAQLSDRELGEAIDANCQTKVCFALAAADAKRMAPHFQPRLDAYDLQHLGAYTIACRILHDARELPAATATTLPPPSLTPGDTTRVIRARARHRAAERQAVEAAIRERYGRVQQPPPGRAQADQQHSATGEDIGLDSERDLEIGWGDPLDGPHDDPFEGPPPGRATPHHDNDPSVPANPDNEQSSPSRGRRV